ncbi:hypothetical protein BJ944DRAFT_273120 [Cunninghamella echinulata]|nr:hypothetical protein BJ944DRAFT_273120 [Cunninghamella echinulata]
MFYKLFLIVLIFIIYINCINCQHENLKICECQGYPGKLCGSRANNHTIDLIEKRLMGPCIDNNVYQCYENAPFGRAVLLRKCENKCIEDYSEGEGYDTCN